MPIPKRVTKSKWFNGEGVCVWFGDDRDDECYYAHCIQKIGDEKSTPADDTMMGWIEHMKHKNWWTPKIEEDFKKEVEKYL